MYIIVKISPAHQFIMNAHPHTSCKTKKNVHRKSSGIHKVSSTQIRRSKTSLREGCYIPATRFVHGQNHPYMERAHVEPVKKNIDSLKSKQLT